MKTMVCDHMASCQYVKAGNICWHGTAHPPIGIFLVSGEPGPYCDKAKPQVCEMVQAEVHCVEVK